MQSTRWSATFAGALCASALAAQVSTGAAALTLVSIKVSKEPVPPGGMAQMKVYITEPKPISTGRGGLSFAAYDSIEGIALISPLDDTYGIAVVRGTYMDLSFVSPSGTFGTNLDYPVLTVAGRVPADIPIGVMFPLVLDVDPASSGALRFLDPSGAAYPIEAKPGHLVTAPGVSIHDVRPGSAELPAGSVVTILGSGFVPKTKITLKEVKLSEVRFIDSSRIDVVLGGPALMHGMAVKAVNPDGSRSVYYSYQRTAREGESWHPVLRHAVPVFPRQGRQQATVALGVNLAGLALQNIEASAASVTLELTAADGSLLTTATLVIPSNRFAVRDLSELFGATSAHPTATAIRIRSGTPIQIMGVAVDGAGRATPLLPL